LLRYFISDRTVFGGVDGLLAAVSKYISMGIDYVQIREKDLPPREICELVRTVVAIRGTGRTRILVNERGDIAKVAGADGVHLPAAAAHETLPGLIVARSCHRKEEIRHARADFVTFSPIFDSPGKGPAVGLDALREACAMGVPVFALGGIDPSNADACIEAGAVGVAGIRLFADSGYDATAPKQ
jgi:thiamine-phosphate pyrophosphorylase